MANMCVATAVVLAVAALLQTSMAQTKHIVGDSLGWLVPPGGKIAYETWADMQTFVVGDVLVFNFITGEQNVARVTKEAFDSCNSTSPIFLKTTGPFNYTLDTAGEFYFIGTMDRHCFFGQKLAINVSASAHPTPSPQAPTATPARGPVTYVVGDKLGWLVPPGGCIAYEIWAYDKTFLVGDVLVFNFANETQDVAVVTEEAYDSCNTTTTIAVYTTSPVKYTLTAAGEYFFTSTYSRHCFFGQKLAINVSASASPTPSPQAPTTTPARGPMTYVVGDNLGWLVPPGGYIAYETWAYDKTFLVGDVLVFNFENETQDVAIVTDEAYDSCNTTTTIAVYTTSPVKYTLTAAGEYFFTSTYSRHCFLGQKLAINVTASSSATPPSSTTAPTPSSHPSSSAPYPTASSPSAPPSSTTAPTPSSNTSSSAPYPTASGPSAPPPESSAPARAIFSVSSPLLLIALALVH